MRNARAALATVVCDSITCDNSVCDAPDDCADCPEQCTAGQCEPNCMDSTCQAPGDCLSCPGQCPCECGQP